MDYEEILLKSLFCSSCGHFKLSGVRYVTFGMAKPKGGVAIHTETDKDAETEKEINNIFPGSSSTKPLTQTGFTKVVIKNI